MEARARGSREDRRDLLPIAANDLGTSRIQFVVTAFATTSKITSVATAIAVLSTVVLRLIGSESFRSALVVALAVLGFRVVVMVWGVARRELPWPRLMLPGIVLLEGIGQWWNDGLSHVRMATAVALELAFIIIAVRKLRRISAGGEPLETRIAEAFGALLTPRLARLAAFELVIVTMALRFVLGGWRRAVPPGFTYHRESGLRVLLPMLPLLAVGDVLLLELVLLPQAATWLKVVVHALALYGLIWLIGLYASLRARPHELANGQLTLHRGLLRRIRVPLEQIASISTLPSFADDWKKRAHCKGAIRIDFAGATILELQLRSALRPICVLGEGAPGTRVLLSVDDPAAFVAAVQPSPT